MNIRAIEATIFEVDSEKIAFGVPGGGPGTLERRGHGPHVTRADPSKGSRSEDLKL